MNKKHSIKISSDDVAVVDALESVLIERDYQDNKWGNVREHGHTIGEWVIILEGELAEAKQAILKGGTGRDSVLSEIVQVAAVAIACLEQHGTGEIKGRAI